MAQHQDLTIFSTDDDLVVLAGYGAADVNGNVTTATFSTDPAHVRPYLKYVDDVGESTVDFLTGGSVIGQLMAEIVDKRRTAADKDTGIFTYLLADGDGETQLLGVRVVFRQQRDDGTWEVIFDGTCGEITHPKKTTFKMMLRDARERERIMHGFTRASGTCIWPRLGPKEGIGMHKEYSGILPGFVEIGARSMPRVRGFRMQYFEAHTFADGSVAGMVVVPDSSDPFSSETWARETSKEYRDLLTKYGQASARSDGAGTPVRLFNDVLIEWSATGGAGSYTAIGPMPFAPWESAALSNFWTNVFMLEGVGDFNNPNDESATTAASARSFIVFNVTAAEIAAGKKPANGAIVYVRVISNTAPTKDVPLYIEDRFGTLLKKIYDGEYSLPDTFIPVRYDAASVATMALNTEMAIARIEEPVEDLRSWLEENVYVVSGYAPTIQNGKIVPVKYEVPDENVVLFQLDDTNTIDATWQHGSGNVINQVIFEYEREVLATALTSMQQVTPVTQKVILERNRLTADSQRRHGTKPKKFAPVTLRSLVSPYVAFQRVPVNETAPVIFAKRSEELLRRFTNGAQLIASRHPRSAAIDALLPGTWVIVACSWLPDYVTHERGINRLAQIVTVRRSMPHVREFDLLDAGPYDQPIAQPTLGVFTENADGSVSIAVTGVPAGGKAEVQYALGEVVPDTNSGEWLTATPILSANGSARTQPGLWPGRLLWARVRGTQDGARASAWTVPVNSRLNDVALLRHFTLKIEQDSNSANYGKPVVAWENLSGTLGVRVRYEVYAKGAAMPAVLTQNADFDATLETGVVPVTLRAWQQVAVQLVGYPGFAAGVVSGAAGSASAFKRVQRLESHYVKPSVSEQSSRSSTTGTLILDVVDPELQITRVQFRTRAGSGGAWSGFVVDGTLPYGTTITMLPGQSSAISYEVYAYDPSGAELLIAAGTVEFPYEASAGIMQANVRLVSATATTETFTVESLAPDGSRGDVTLLALTGTATLNSGPAVGVVTADGGSGVTFVIDRGAAEGPDGAAAWRASKAPYVSDDDSSVVPSQGKDTFALVASIKALSVTQAYVEIRSSALDPTDQNPGVPYITMTTTWVGLDHVTRWDGAAWVAVASGDTFALTANDHYDFRLYRAAYATGNGRFGSRLSAANRVEDSDSVDVISADATNALHLKVERTSGADTANNEYYNVYVIDPVPQGLNSITLYGDASGCTVTSPGSFSGGVATGTPTGDFSTTGYVTVEIARPAEGSPAGTVSLRATASGRLMGAADITVAPKNAGSATTAVVGAVYIASVNTGTDTVTVAWSYTGSLGGGDFEVIRIRTAGGSPDLSGGQSAAGTTTGSSLGDVVPDDIDASISPVVTYSYQVRVRDASGTVLRVSSWESITLGYTP
jgi:hypothetical protein